MIFFNKNTQDYTFVFSLFFIVMGLFLSSCGLNPSSQSQIRNTNSNTVIAEENQSGEMQHSVLKKADEINNYIGFLNANQVNKIKNYRILGSNFHPDQSVFNVAFFLPSSNYRNESLAFDEVVKQIHSIYKTALASSNLVLSDVSDNDSTGRVIYKISGIDCLESYEFSCRVEIGITDLKINPSPKFIYRDGGSFFVKAQIKLHLPKDNISSESFYQSVSSKLPNWSFNLVDYETAQVVHIQRGYQKYFF